MSLIGYARVSTADQSTTSQKETLLAAGCKIVHEENASGGDRSRPVLKRLLSEIRAGDTLIVVRIDRLARSLSHLLEVIEGLQERGASFRSLTDPIDTSSPQGKFTLQVLGAAAEFERSLIRERTRAGLESARKRGRVGGNPGLKSGNPEALKRIRNGRDEGSFRRLSETAEQWVPEVRRFRPEMPWEDLVRIINSRLPEGVKPWTQDRLTRAVKRYVREGLLEGRVLERATPKNKDDRLMAIVAGIKGANPEMTLQDVAHRLQAMREQTPRGRSSWSVSSVKMLLDRASRHGLIPE